MKATFILLIISIFSFQSFAEMSAEEKGNKIAEIVEKEAKGFIGEEAKLTMDIIAASGDTLSRGMVIKTKERKEGDYLLLEVTDPPDIKGTKLLTWSHKTDDDEQWLYLPAIKRVKRISGSLKSGSFMGSEFSYEEFQVKERTKFKFKFIKDDVHKNRKAWVVERVAKQESGYSKEVLWYDIEYKAVVKEEYYDRKGALFKVAHINGYKKHLNRWWRPTSIDMLNVQTKNRSVMTWKGLRLKVKLDDSLFLSDNLKE